MEEVVEQIIEILIAFFLAKDVVFRAVGILCILDTVEFGVTAAAELFEDLFGGSHSGMIG